MFLDQKQQKKHIVEKKRYKMSINSLEKYTIPAFFYVGFLKFFVSDELRRTPTNFFATKDFLCF